MQHGEFYKLDTDTLGIRLLEPDQKVPMFIPKGATVTIRDPGVEGNRFVDVEWDGNLLTIFAEDLYGRGQQVVGLPGTADVKKKRRITSCLQYGSM